MYWSLDWNELNDCLVSASPGAGVNMCAYNSMLNYIAHS